MAWPCITCGSAEIMSGCSLATAQVCSVSSGKRNTLSQLGRGAAGQVRAMLARWAGPVH
jgi:hypothetical protein